MQTIGSTWKTYFYSCALIHSRKICHYSSFYSCKFDCFWFFVFCFFFCTIHADLLCVRQIISLAACICVRLHPVPLRYSFWSCKFICFIHVLFVSLAHAKRWEFVILVSAICIPANNLFAQHSFLFRSVFRCLCFSIHEQTQTARAILCLFLLLLHGETIGNCAYFCQLVFSRLHLWHVRKYSVGAISVCFWFDFMYFLHAGMKNGKYSANFIFGPWKSLNHSCVRHAIVFECAPPHHSVSLRILCTEECDL